MKDPIVPLPPSTEKHSAPPTQEEIDFEIQKYNELRDAVAKQVADLLIEMMQSRQKLRGSKKC